MIKLIHRYLVYPLQDFIYPPVCFTCDELLPEGQERICTGCWNSFTSPDSSSPTWKEIHEKFHAEGVVEDFLSCFLFEKEGKLQEVIHHLKYGGMKSLGVRLGEELGRRLQSDERFASADFLVPVPLHKLKRRERGYNQSEYICRGISHVSGIPVAGDFLSRTKHTQSQTQLSLLERKGNVSEAFSILPEAALHVRGKTCVLVDDVITTGSTINACARELLSAHARRVYGASVALAR